MRGIRYTSLTIVVVTGLTGCPGSVPDLVPSEVPSELVIVLDDAQRFAEEGHPLVPTETGTEIGPIADLSGCWGRYARSEVRSPTTGEIVGEDFFGVLILDETTGTLSKYTITPHLYLEVRRYLIKNDGPYRVLGSNRIAREITHTEAGVIEPDGSISWDYDAAVVAAINFGVDFETLITVDDDHLKTLDGGLDNPPENLTTEWAARNTTLWVRFECP